MKRDLIDFHEVPTHQLPMHARLEEWARSCFGGYGSSTAPMFRQYRSNEVWEAPSASIPIDHAKAAKLGVAVKALPKPHMLALDWYYVRQGSVMLGRRRIGCTTEDLSRYVIDGRQMLINRNA